MPPDNPPPPSLALTVAHLSVSFAGRRVLHDLTLSLPERRLHVILGRSGAGKTTFLRVFNRLNESFEDCKTQGAVRLRLDQQWLDIYQDQVSLPELRRRVGIVFQTPNILPMSIERNLTLPLKLVAGLKKPDIKAKLEWALRVAQLWDEVKDRLGAPAATLSGGQQQRLCLARVLALDPQILLLDEPTASLDFLASQKIESLLLDLKERYTILAVSHSLGQAQRLADNVLVLHAGRLARTIPRLDLHDETTLRMLLTEIL